MNPTALEYVEHHPSGPLGTRVRCIWALRAPADPANGFEPVFPDGCMELVFNLAASFDQLRGGVVARQPTELLVGQLLEPIRLRPTGRTDILGVRFQPWGMYGVPWASPGELAGRTLSLAGLGRPLGSGIAERLWEVPDLRSRCLAMEASLIAGGYGRNVTPPPPAVAALARGTLRSVTRAALDAGISTRQVERLSDRWTGLGPRELIRLARFQRALSRLRRSPERPLSRIAHESGFADHAHFTRDFSRFAGLTPSLFRAAIAPLTAAFIPEAEDGD